jgi:hypothetical protein
MGYKSERQDIYHIISANGPENYGIENYIKVFPNQKKENMVIIKDIVTFAEKPYVV